MKDFQKQNQIQTVQLKKHVEDQIKWLYPRSPPEFKHKISENFEVISEYRSELRKQGFCISLGAEGSLSYIASGGASASGARGKENNKNNTEFKEEQNIYISILKITPKIAFCLDDTQIELTDLAREKAKKVANNKSFFIKMMS